MRCVYSDRYVIDIGAHVFPTAKYRRVRDQLLARNVVPPASFVEPEAATWEELALVHEPGYLRRVREGALSLTEIARLELPWSAAMVDGFRLMSGGTSLAARFALADTVAVHLGGGFHHAFPDHGEGFCLFNDVAIAIRRLQSDGRVRRVAVIDCDVHHGNGTAAVFAGDPTVFTLSMHQEANYPYDKPSGTLDIGLADGTGDDEYLELLTAALVRIVAFGPDLACYLAGADPYRDDQLGGLGLTLDGLRRRDRAVLEHVIGAGIPIVVTLAGGYARRLADTVAIHVATIEEAAAVAGRP